ncbi:MAG TPA: hypothetical protein VF768_02895, partial [Holophagaceae bacterium]
TFEQPLTLRMDPRVKAPAEALAAQYALGRRLAEAMARSHAAAATAPPVRAQELQRLNGELGGLLVATQQADAAPTPAQAEAGHALVARLDTVLSNR